jgi:altronate dehydratase small subunit
MDGLNFAEMVVSQNQERRIDVSQSAILLNVNDDVATALVGLNRGESVNVALNDVSLDIVLREDVPFGHKYALRDIAEGEEILKYGLPIGKALADIRAGEWVHVHNCRSERFGFRHEKYGVNA